MLNIPPGINHDESLENEARRLERERIIDLLAGLQAPICVLRWDSETDSPYGIALDHDELREALNP